MKDIFLLFADCALGLSIVLLFSGFRGKSNRERISDGVRLAFALILLGILCSCSPPLPPIGAASPAGIAWDSNVQNAGIIAAHKDASGAFDGFEVSDGYRARYGGLWDLYGAKAMAPKNPFYALGNDWVITAEGAEKYTQMLRASRAP